jgi:precorrin-3B C17-methyltransferase
VVGIGPGGPQDRTRAAEEALAASGVIVGYTRYLDLVADLTRGKELISSGMTKEVDRCRAALERALQGETVALISSGDPGVYGMAGLALELAAQEGLDVPMEIIPGVSAAFAAAAKMGAPLTLDFACISLSDLLVPWEMIKRRLDGVAAADLVTVIFNPKSRKRSWQIEEAAEVFRACRSGETPVGIGTAVGTPDEEIVLSDLNDFLSYEINMRSIVIVGNSTSTVINGRFVTPRGYRL